MGKMERRVFLSIVVVILLLLVLWGVSLLVADNPPPTYSVSFLVRADNGRLQRGAEQAAIDYNIDLHMISGYRSGEADKQIDYLNREVRSQVDGIILAPEDSELLEDYFRGNRISMPTMTLFTALDETISEHVGINNVQAGELLAQAVLASDRQPVVLILPPFVTAAAESRTEAFLEAMAVAEVPVEVLTAADDETLGTLLLERPDSVFVFPEDAQIAAACRMKGENQLIFGCGFQTSLRTPLETGEITALVVWSDYDIGYLALERVVAKLRGELELVGDIALYIADSGNMYDPPLAQILFPIG